jgi:APA family basic amino acid/polyamine antiporter
VELGDFMAFVAAGNILLEYCIGGAAVARSWTSYFATLLNHHPNDFRVHAASLADDYSRLDPIAVAVVLLICLSAALSTKGSSRFNYVLSIVHIAVLAFIIVAGLTRAQASNLTADFAPFGARGVFAASAVLFFAYIGFDAVSTMAEETRNPARDIPIGLVGAMTLTTVLYCVLALVLCLMQPYAELDPDAPFSVAFTAAGMDWAKYIVAFGALKGMTTVLLVSAVGQARYLTHIARTHMVPPCLAAVHPRFGTPVNATVVMAVATAVIALFTDLGILSNLLSISTLFIFTLVALALLVRRYYVAGETSAADRNKLAACLAVVLASSVATAACWGVEAGGWVPYAVTGAAWVAATAFLQLGVPMARTPRTWGVPLVPWLPAASILINVFLLGSMDAASFVRFGVWTAALLAYYLLFGLHASYDTARELAAEADAARVEEGARKAGVGGGGD